MDNLKDLERYIKKLETKQAIIKEKLEELKKKFNANKINTVNIQKELDELKERFEKLERKEIVLYDEAKEIVNGIG